MAEATLLKSPTGMPTYEGKPIVLNPDGSWSHERSITIEVGGRHMNIPTMFGGKQVSPQTAVEILRKNNWVDPDNGKKIPVFSSKAEAIRAAQEKEKKLQSMPLTPEQLKMLQQKPQDVKPEEKQSGATLLRSVWDALGGKVD